MAKQQYQPNPRINQIFEDLEKYLEFCQDYGYKFDETSLYDMRSFAYRQHQKQLAGKWAKDQWAEDTRP
jgi:phenolic acid decarboxylase